MTWLLLALAVAASPAEAARIKDVAAVYGIRENSLMGYGLVVGLNKTGDSQQNAATMHSLAARLSPLGVPVTEADIKSKNVAIVLVTATLPAGARPGTHLDLTVSSAGDARSLEGGTLLLTPLIAPNRMEMASAQGHILVGGYSVEGGGNETIKNHPTVGMVPRGGIVEKEIPGQLDIGEQTTFDWVLDQPDFTNSTRMATVVNALLGPDTARAVDNGTVRVQVPDGWLGRQAELIATVESLELPLDHVLKVVVNERTGTVVMGADIPLTPLAIAHGGLSIEVSRQNEVSQPNPLAKGETTPVTNTEVRVREEKGKVTLLKGSTVGDVVGALNSMGVTPRDLIVILDAMRAAGGLQAEIESR